MKTGPSTVLAVEDEALILLSIADELREAGFLVLEASNAAAAIRKLETHPEISILFTDVHMPGEIDGLQLSEIVRGRCPDIKIIVTSGKFQPEVENLPVADVFIPKPYEPKKILGSIERLLS